MMIKLMTAVTGALLALALAGCSADQAASSRTARDDGAVSDSSPGQGSLFGDPCAKVEDAPLPEHCAEDAADDAHPISPAGKERSSAPSLKPVRLTKKSRTLGSCIYGEPCESKELRADGGNGKRYAWSMEGGPSGLSLENIGNSDSARIVGTATQLGPFNVMITVADLDNETDSDQRVYSLVVTDTIAIELYRYDAAEREWNRIEKPGGQESYEQISLAPNTDLMLKVIGHDEGSNYTWSLGGAQMECDDGEGGYCAVAIGEELTLVSASAGETTARGLTAYLHTTAEYLDRDFQNVPITARDSYGNEATVRIASMEFQRDPCTVPLAIEREPAQPIPVSIDNPSFQFRLTVSGGRPPYRMHASAVWSEHSDWVQEVQLSTEGEDGNTIMLVRSAIAVPANVDLNEISTVEPWGIAVTISDTCPASQPLARTYTIELDADTVVQADSGEFDSTVVLGANDTDGDSKLWAKLIDDRDETVASWGDGKNIRLDPYGDNSESQGVNCDVDGDDTHCRFSIPRTMFVRDNSGKIDIARANEVLFIANDPGDGDLLDVMFYEFTAEVGGWCGRALQMPHEHECNGDRCEWRFPMAWKRTDGLGTCSFRAPTEDEIDEGRAGHGGNVLTVVYDTVVGIFS